MSKRKQEPNRADELLDEILSQPQLKGDRRIKNRLHRLASTLMNCNHLLIRPKIIAP